MKYRSWNRNDTRWSYGGIFITAAIAICFLLSWFTAPICRADDQGPDGQEKAQEEPIDFTSLSLEELKQVMIVSILKKPQKLSEATSAISVITQDDIRRSGATSIPELLRGLPGLQVAQINSSTWAVSARGFNHRFANKLLVLMDGRCLYTPSFSGVYWNVQDTLFEDIERIEVIRGPGATLWGANAVNGVINIITKKAKDTQGGLHVIGSGKEELGIGAFRYGARLGESAYGRFYLKYFLRDGFVNKSGDHGNDDWNSLRGGGRIDWSLSGSDSLTLQGDIYDGENGEREVVFVWPGSKEKSININNNFSGSNVLGRWAHTFSNSSGMALQVYYDRTEQEKQLCHAPSHTESFDTFDLDFQHNFRLISGAPQEIVWGLGYRLIQDRLNFGGDNPIFVPEDKNHDTHIVSAFLQDEIDVVRNRLQLTLGSKFEHTDYSGFQFQPSIRMLYKIPQNQNIWASVSRALRTPSLYEQDTSQPAPPPPPSSSSPSSPSSSSTSSTSGKPQYPNDKQKSPVILELKEDKHVQPEELIACELGYRIQPEEYFSLDSAIFYNDYDQLIVGKENIGQGESYGLELAANWDVTKYWALRFSYTFLRVHTSVDEDAGHPRKGPGADLPNIFLEGISPDHQVVVHSSVDLLRDLEFDMDLRYVDNLGSYTESYLEADARLGWNLRKNLELSVVGRNLLNNRHSEFVYMGYIPDSAGVNIEVERSIYWKITCRF